MSLIVEIDIKDELDSDDIVKLVRYFCNPMRFGKSKLDADDLNEIIKIINNSGIIKKQECNLNYQMKMELINEVIDDFTIEELTNRLKK